MPAPAPVPAPAPAAVPVTTTLPLFGVPLVVDVTTGPGGAIASVAVNPATDPTIGNLTATKDKPNKVVFVNDAGTARIVVKANGGGQSVSARAGSLADISGPGIWHGSVFGTDDTTVNFTIAAAADGGPDITGITSSDATATIGTVSHETDDNSQEASVRIRFTSGVQARTLTIKAEVDTEEGVSHAKLQVALSKLKGVSLPADQVAGPQTWNGLLCDGTAASITYTVAADGTISDVVATPATGTVKTDSNKIEVRFSQNERVRIRVKGDNGQLKISVNEKIRCDSPPPSVNTPIASTSSVPGNGNGGHHGGGDNNGGGNGGGDDNKNG